MIHEICNHLTNNWHKYGVIFLLLKEAKDFYKFLAELKSMQELFTWLKEKFGFKKS